MIKFMKSNNLKMGILGYLILFSLYSCEVEKIEPSNPIPPETEEPAKPDEPSQPENPAKPQEPNQPEQPDQPGQLEIVGNGSGSLVIKDVEGKRYSIKPGTYSNFHLENIRNTSIDGLNQVKVKNGTVFMSRVNGVSLTNITIEDSNQQAINIYDEANDLTLQNINIRNINNYAIRFLLDKKYDGSPSSYSKNIHLINIKAENIGSLFGSRGEIKADGFYGLIKGFKLTNSSIINSPNLSNGIYVGCVEDYEISNNVVNNVNKSDNFPDGNNFHNGIFHLNGNGKMFKNKITNHQGNSIRAWLFSITKPGTVEIYDNIVYNSTRYSAFELQVPPYMEVLPSFKPADAKIYNNTTGQLNTGQPKYYEGRIVDIYQTHGNVEVYNNLYFNMRDNIVSLNQSNPNDTKVKETNNVYFKNTADAVFDLVSFKSKVSGVGAR